MNFKQRWINSHHSRFILLIKFQVTEWEEEILQLKTNIDQLETKHKEEV